MNSLIINRFSNNTKLCWNGLLSSNTGKRPPLGNRNMDSSMPNIHVGIFDEVIISSKNFVEVFQSGHHLV